MVDSRITGPTRSDGVADGAAARTDDRGGAMIEFLAMSLLLLVPLLYVIVTVSRVQAGAYAAESAASGASRAAVVAGVSRLEDGSAYAEALEYAETAATAVADLAAADFGIDAEQAQIRLDCTADPCLTPGSDVVARSTVTVTLPGVPGFLSDAGLVITLTAESSSPIDGMAG